MDGEGFGSAAEGATTNWEVYKDAFAPPAPSRRVKAWERAPVSAHAPRLQGQKVWKKVGVKTHSKADDKENLGHEAAQQELEMGGMGARKRARVRGGNKEDISDALWAGMKEQENGVLVVSPKKQRMSMGPGDRDAFVVPRKRTNANHLITPRKGRKVPLGEHLQVTITTSTSPKTLTQSPAKLSPQKIPLEGGETAQDGVESPTKAVAERIPLNDLDQNENGVTLPAEKPVRRRKSLRRSTRRLTRGTTPEQPPAAPAEAALPNSEPATSSVEASSKDAEALEDVPAVPELDVIALAEGYESNIPANIQGRASQEDAAVSVPKLQQEIQISAESPLIKSAPTTTVLDGESFTQGQEVVQIPSPGTSHDALASTAVEPAATIEDSATAVSEGTPKSKHPVLSSIEIGTETQFTSPTKTGTPRQKRKTPQRRGSRRSARSIRANSVPPEDRPNHDASETQHPQPSSSPIKPRTAKTPTKKARRSTVHAAEAIKDASAQPATSQEDESTPHTSKAMVESEIHVKQVESTGTTGIITTQPSETQQENVGILDFVPEATPSTSNSEGEDPDLAQELSGENVVNGHDDVPFEIGKNTPTENEIFSCSPQPLHSEGLPKVVNPSWDEVREGSLEALEVLEPISISISAPKLLDDSIEEPADELPESSTPNPSTTELVEAISENAPANTFDHDDTDMLRNFLTRVKANKAAKAGTSIPKRKRSLPHSPIRLPLESVDADLSPSSPKVKDEFDVSLPAHVTTKRKQEDADLGDDEARESKSIRRSGRTRLPVKAAPLAAPSFIPVRRLGQDGDNTVTLKRNEEKELAALTRVNTRKNKGGAQLPMQVLAKQAEEKEDPASRQRALKEVFDEKAQRQKKGKKRKTVIWAEELAQFQTEEGKTAELDKEPEKEKEKSAPVEEKKTAVKVGVRSKTALGMAVNGTPAPKRKMRGRS